MDYKIRGKRVDNGEWVYGCLIIDYISGKHYIHQYGNSVNESEKVNQEGCLHFMCFEVYIECIGQFTGMYDKTAWDDLTILEQKEWVIDLGNTYGETKVKEVYEGDIIPYHFDSRIYGVVTYGEYKNPNDDKFSTHVGFYLKWNSENADMFFRKDLRYWLSASKVVGNIHDRKENEDVATSNQA